MLRIFFREMKWNILKGCNILLGIALTILGAWLGHKFIHEAAAAFMWIPGAIIAFMLFGLIEECEKNWESWKQEAQHYKNQQLKEPRPSDWRNE